jgi:hypothetical protein
MFQGNYPAMVIGTAGDVIVAEHSDMRGCSWKKHHTYATLYKTES